MSKVISYAELNSLVRDKLGLESDIVNVQFDYIEGKEVLRLILKSDKPDVKAYVEHVYKCNDCLGSWKEPGVLINESCRLCGSENVELIKTES